MTVKFMPLEVRNGDYVTYLKEMAVNIIVDGKNYSVVPERAIVCVERESLSGDNDGKD